MAGVRFALQLFTVSARGRASFLSLSLSVFVSLQRINRSCLTSVYSNVPVADQAQARDTPHRREEHQLGKRVSLSLSSPTL